MADKPEKQDRSDRLGKALRANLRRRKQVSDELVKGSLERRTDPLAPVGRASVISQSGGKGEDDRN